MKKLQADEMGRYSGGQDSNYVSTFYEITRCIAPMLDNGMPLTTAVELCALAESNPVTPD